MHTKKVGSMGRFGVRYGTRTKGVCRAIEAEQKKPQSCPYCERPALNRIAAGIWCCKKCGNKFAGGAYLPRSAVAEAVLKSKQG
jgi:large subunit ribosomal protein L37Ae